MEGMEGMAEEASTLSEVERLCEFRESDGTTEPLDGHQHEVRRSARRDAPPNMLEARTRTRIRVRVRDGGSIDG